MPEFKLPARAATVSDLLDAATAVFRMTLAKTLPAGLFAILLAALPNMYWLTTGKPVDLLHPPRDAKFWALTAVGFAAYQLLAAVLMLRQRAMLRGAAPDLRQEFAAALARWPMLMLTAMLAGVAVFAGALALLIPGVFALVCFLLLRPVVLFETLDPLRALGRCVSLVRPIWSKVLASAIIAGLVFVVCVIAAAAGLGIVQAVAVALGAQPAPLSALAAACELGVQAVALVYFNALWLVLYSAASSSA
jgi:hypothetical protein